jgi:translation initiation factor IF-3
MPPAPKNRPRANEQIRARQVRLVAEDGSQLGIVPLTEALARADRAGLDLVEVAPDAAPPVCRIMDFGRHNFEMAARAKENRRRASHTEVKEMRFSVRIADGDFKTKTRKVAAFLEQGHRVKVSVRFRRGREMSRPQFGRQLLEDLVQHLDAVKVETPPRLDGTFMSMLLAPGPRTARAPSDGTTV